MHRLEQRVVEPIEPRLALERVAQPAAADPVAQREHALAILREQRIAKDDVQRPARVLQVLQFVEDVVDGPRAVARLDAMRTIRAELRAAAARPAPAAIRRPAGPRMARAAGARRRRADPTRETAARRDRRAPGSARRRAVSRRKTSRINAASGSPSMMKSASASKSCGSFWAASPMNPTRTPRRRIARAHAVSRR